MKVSQKPLGRSGSWPGGTNVSGTAVVITCCAMGDRGTNGLGQRTSWTGDKLTLKPGFICCVPWWRKLRDRPAGEPGAYLPPLRPLRLRDARRVGTVTRHALPLRPPRGAGRGGPLGRPVESAGPHGPAASTGTHRRPREAGSVMRVCSWRSPCAAASGFMTASWPALPARASTPTSITRRSTPIRMAADRRACDLMAGSEPRWADGPRRAPEEVPRRSEPHESR